MGLLVYSIDNKDRALRWNIIHEEWAYILWLDPGKKRKTAVKELREIEDHIKEVGLKGWIAESEFQYAPMHRILKKLGAQIYSQDHESYYFKKDMTHGKST